MPTSSTTESSPEASPMFKDFALTSEGHGPGLIDFNDKIQNSDKAFLQHLNRVSKDVGAAPATRPTTGPYAEHVEHRDLERPPTQSTAFTNSSRSLEHATTLSSIRKTIGLSAEAPILEGHEVHSHLAWSSVRVIMREPFAEFFGTFIMILFGDGSVAQVLLSGSGFGNYQSINWAWGLGVMLGIYVAGDSGAFLNPAVMLGFCVYRKFPWRRFPIYFVAQVLGAFCASGVVYANYISAIDKMEGHGIRTVPPSPNATAGIFCTYPQPFLTKASQFFSEFIASSILMFVIFALKDDSNPGAMGKSGAGELFPLALLFLIFGLGACFGWETGYAINLARDFGPRLMSYAVGYGSEVWSAGGYYFWVPMVAPFGGCLFGGFLYDFFIYTGPESPINSPWLGFKYLLNGGYWKTKKEGFEAGEV
ncbi:aquaporin-like protein [Coleophoma cylindrospora]|uniref:Aquaporin-like protein n=1 Tax=Coleophoma cylindrospora TaxID=1849047 RepID=A0A3D8RUP1_9HELO|nr:aquaporin-like protein [Coleophoma cylindrospora]